MGAVAGRGLLVDKIKEVVNMSHHLDVQVVRLHRCDGESKLKGFVDISVGETVIVKGLRIIEGRSGLFIGMPQQQGKDGRQLWRRQV